MANYCYYVFVIVAVLATIKTAESLWCWECTSGEGDTCSDYFNETMARRQGYIYGAQGPKEKNCEEGRATFYVGQQKTVCLKKVQTIYGRKQYTRSCAFINPSEALDCTSKEQTGGQTTTDYCQYCDNTSYCNGATTIRTNMLWIALLPFAATFWVVRK